MPVRYTFSGNLLRVNLEDTYTLDEMMKTFMDALNDPLFPENARFFTGCQTIFSAGRANLSRYQVRC